jgi:tetratricopeptide (TPR) repeat protein
LAINPHDFNTLYNKGVSLGKLGNYIGAIQYYDKALVIQPNATNALINKGISLYDLGKYNDAIISYDKALALNPNDVDTINNKANALGKLGKSLEAIQLCQRAIKLIQSNQTSRLAFTPSKSLYMFISEIDTSNIESVVSGDDGQNQKIIIIQMTLAEQYASINDYHEAIATYTGILHVNQYNGCALLGRADAYKKIGQVDNATRDETIGNMLKLPVILVERISKSQLNLPDQIY